MNWLYLACEMRWTLDFVLAQHVYHVKPLGISTTLEGAQKRCGERLTWRYDDLVTVGKLNVAQGWAESWIANRDGVEGEYVVLSYPVQTRSENLVQIPDATSFKEGDLVSLINSGRLLHKDEKSIGDFTSDSVFVVEAFDPSSGRLYVRYENEDGYSAVFRGDESRFKSADPVEGQ